MLKFRQGKVVRFRAFREPEQALESAGLRGSDPPARSHPSRSGGQRMGNTPSTTSRTSPRTAQAWIRTGRAVRPH